METRGEESPKMGAAKNLPVNRSLEEELQKAKEYASRINGEDKDKIRTYKGPSNETIIRTLIEIGYTAEEAKAAVAATI